MLYSTACLVVVRNSIWSRSSLWKFHVHSIFASWHVLQYLPSLCYMDNLYIYKRPEVFSFDASVCLNYWMYMDKWYLIRTGLMCRWFFWSKISIPTAMEWPGRESKVRAFQFLTKPTVLRLVKKSFHWKWTQVTQPYLVVHLFTEMGSELTHWGSPHEREAPQG